MAAPGARNLITDVPGLAVGQAEDERRAHRRHRDPAGRAGRRARSTSGAAGPARGRPTPWRRHPGRYGRRRRAVRRLGLRPCGRRWRDRLAGRPGAGFRLLGRRPACRARRSCRRRSSTIWPTAATRPGDWTRPTAPWASRRPRRPAPTLRLGTAGAGARGHGRRPEGRDRARPPRDGRRLHGGAPWRRSTASARWSRRAAAPSGRRPSRSATSSAAFRLGAAARRADDWGLAKRAAASARQHHPGRRRRRRRPESGPGPTCGDHGPGRPRPRASAPSTRPTTETSSSSSPPAAGRWARPRPYPARLGALAADCLARAVASGVYEAASWPGAGALCWRDLASQLGNPADIRT